MRLRLTTACPQCRRQYSVADRMVGKKFHCHCGEAITVERPSGYDATIVACSSCGAPRENNRPACGHCGSDFTLREQDLDTVCPGCVARISKYAKYCHHCGLAIAPESIRKRAAPLMCPACDGEKQLAWRRLGAQRAEVAECQLCAGLWIPLACFERILHGEGLRVDARGGPQFTEYQSQRGRMYRPCAHCRQLMVRQHFGRGKSRVILDICGDHGAWFDHDELARLLTWVRSGGAEDALLDLAKLKTSKNRQLKRRAHELDSPPPPGKSYAAEASIMGHYSGRRLPRTIRGLFSLFGW